MTNNPIQRRTLLQGLVASSSVWAAPALWAQSASRSQSEGRLIVVFLRGAYDGLSALVPFGDANYYRLRPNIGITAPDGTLQTTLALDTTFGLHPALQSLMPLWKQGVLAAIPAAGSPHASRSHFDAQLHWELGVPGKSSGEQGWMNALANLREVPQPEGTRSAISVGEANPMILAGAAPVQRVPKGNIATRQGALGDERTRNAVMGLYAGQDSLSRNFQSGAQSRIQTARILSEDLASTDMASPQMLAANNGAGSAKGLLLDAQHLGTLMRKDSNLRLGFLSAGGWDTHANQGSVEGSLANNLHNLAAAVTQLRRDFSRPDDVVVIASEFGRTSAENGTRGTDHGHGNTMWLLGDRVLGGRWHGTWTGLSHGNLHEGRDLPVHHDFRAVFAQVLRASQGLRPAEVDRLFPGFNWDASLDRLMRA